MPSISLPAALAISAGTGLAGAAISGGAAKDAAKTQAQAADQATAVQQAEFNQTQANLAPYIQGGPNAFAQLMAGTGSGPGGTGTGPLNAPSSALAQLISGVGAGPGGTGTGPLNAPFNPTDLANTPGYQFTMDQGLQALLNTQSARGGVDGGNTLKAITEFGQNLAGTTFEQRLQDYLQQNLQSYNMLSGAASLSGQQQAQSYDMLSGIAGLGENAAAGLGNTGAQVANSIGQNIIGAGNARAAGTVGSANAINSGVSGIGQNFLLAQLMGGGAQPGAAGLPFTTLGADPSLSGLSLPAAASFNSYGNLVPGA